MSYCYTGEFTTHCSTRVFGVTYACAGLAESQIECFATPLVPGAGYGARIRARIGIALAGLRSGARGCCAPSSLPCPRA